MAQEIRKDDGEESLLEKSKRRWNETYKNLKPVNADPELLVLGGADEAATAAAADETKED